MSTPNTHLGPAEIGRIMKSVRSVFFIGIGGVNMSSLAEITFMKGYSVRGSDRTSTAITESLETKGIEIFYAHEASNIEGSGAVVYTTAISQDNPEYKAALVHGIPVISRADYLGFIMTAWPVRIGVCGMHGKSTTTSMTALAFTEAGANPTALCGACMPDLGGYYRMGGDNFFIFEACEYLDAFLDFNPTVAIILNIEMDHVDYFKSITQVRRSFANFASLTGPEGAVIANWDDENVRAAISATPCNIFRLSTQGNREAEWQALNIDLSRGLPSFDVSFKGEIISHIDLNIPGKHNVGNALSAFVAAYICGLPADGIAEGLSHFGGAERRMEFKGKMHGADVYDDYAHHPTEIAASLKGFRDMGYDNVYCVYQPHTYSRTAGLFEDFVNALGIADTAFLCDIYAAREQNTFGVSSEKLAEAIGRTGVYVGSFENAASAIDKINGPRTAIVIMGAGDITKIFPMLTFDENN